jgi:hypothetical protein
MIRVNNSRRMSAAATPRRAAMLLLLRVNTRDWINVSSCVRTS